MVADAGWGYRWMRPSKFTDARDRAGVAAGESRNAPRYGLPNARHHADHLLPLAPEVRAGGGWGAPGARPAPRGESEAQADRRRPAAGHPAGTGAPAKEVGRRGGPGDVRRGPLSFQRRRSRRYALDRGSPAPRGHAAVPRSADSAARARSHPPASRRGWSPRARRGARARGESGANIASRSAGRSRTPSATHGTSTSHSRYSAAAGARSARSTHGGHRAVVVAGVHHRAHEIGVEHEVARAARPGDVAAAVGQQRCARARSARRPRGELDDRRARHRCATPPATHSVPAQLGERAGERRLARGLRARDAHAHERAVMGSSRRRGRRRGAPAPSSGASRGSRAPPAPRNTA